MDKLTNRLASIGIDEATVEYAVGILADQDMDMNEKRTILNEIIIAAVEDESTHASSSRLVDEALGEWNQIEEERHEREKQDRLHFQQEAKEKEARILRENIDTLEDKAREGKRTDMTEGEWRQRQHLLAQYAYETDELVENSSGEVDIIYKDRSAKSSVRSMCNGLDVNENAAKVKAEEATKRALSKQKHQLEVERNKELLEQQRLKKEKDKQRTQKKEKRRM